MSTNPPARSSRPIPPRRPRAHIEDTTSSSLADEASSATSSAQSPGGAQRRPYSWPALSAGGRVQTDAQVDAHTITEADPPSGRVSAVSPGRRRSVFARPVGDEQAAQLMGPSPQAATPTLEDRLNEKRAAQRRLHLRRISQATAAIITCAALIWGVFFSPVLALRPESIKVTGVDEDLVTTTQVTAALAPWSDVPLPRIDRGAAAAAVKALTPVKDASVEWAFPSGLSVNVTLRQGTMVEAADGGYLLVDAEGVVLRQGLATAEGLPVVAFNADGDRVSQAQAFTTIWNALGQELQSQVASLSCEGLSYRVNLVSGSIIQWGPIGDDALKARVAATLIAHRGGSVYDVSSPTHPVVS